MTVSHNLLVDAHEDLAYNMRTFGRDYTRSVAETRRYETNTDIPAFNGQTLLGWDAYQQGRVAVVFSTLFAGPVRHKGGEWDTQTYETFDEAHALYKAQIEAYHRLVDDHPDKYRLIYTRSDLDAVLADWRKPLPEETEETGPVGHTVGMVVLMENAEGVRAVSELEEWWSLGVRMIGPAWTGTRYCGGTKEPGPLTKDGYALLEAMAELGFALDLSHMDERAALQALDTFPGHMIASHANAKALLEDQTSNRQLPDAVIEGLVGRGGVIGLVPFNIFLKSGWKRGDERELVPLQTYVNHIDYVCQIAGDAKHAAIGTDFDGGFGLDCVPLEIGTIADMHKIVPLLVEKGYSDADVSAILGQNWLRILQETLPEH
ncbi:MAG: membrane dipeptidase [Anaerolineales bacterium]|nr:membrane dipeptidase [Anaerolineales bacterium]